MCRGFLSSWRYSVICRSERCLPNQVFHHNRKGMRTISQPVAKKRIFWVRDIERLGLGETAGSSVTEWLLLVIGFSSPSDLKQRCRVSFPRWIPCQRGQTPGSGCPGSCHDCHP